MFYVHMSHCEAQDAECIVLQTGVWIYNPNRNSVVINMISIPNLQQYKLYELCQTIRSDSFF